MARGKCIRCGSEIVCSLNQGSVWNERTQQWEVDGCWVKGNATTAEQFQSGCLVTDPPANKGGADGEKV